MRSFCVVVPKAEGENIRNKLSEMGVLRKDLRIARDEDRLYIPIGPSVDLDYPVEEREFEENEQFSSYRELLDLPSPLEEQLPGSFDVIGDVYVIKLVDDLIPHAGEIGAAILQAHRNAKTVALDRGVQGEFRTRDLEVIAGEERTHTTHREFGLSYELDLAKVYFSPRLATERRRVSQLVTEGECVIDMFAGVGPFSLMMARHSQPRMIYAIDKNPEAINYLIKNIKLNKIKSISPMLGDARDLMPELSEPDRIIMNLPHSSLDFLDVALARVKPGGVIHLYLISEVEGLAGVEERMSGMVENVRTVHTYSARENLYCFDLVTG